MKYCFLGVCLFVFMAGAAQDRFYPPQVDGNNFIIDGQLNEAAWTKATAVPFDIEFSPANNEPAKRATTAYIAYSSTHLFVGFMPNTILKLFAQQCDQEMIAIFGTMTLF